MKKIAIIGVLILALAIIVGGVMAQGRGAGMGGRMMNQGACMAQGPNQGMGCQQMLNLTQEQAAEMQRLRTAFQNDTAGLRTQLQTKQQEMAQLWTAQNPDLRRIKAKAAETDQIRARIRDRAIDMHYTMMTQVLTPEQRAKCAECCKSGQCGMGCGMADGTCPMGGCGMGMGPGAGMGPMGCAGTGACPAGGAGMGRGTGMGMGPTGTGCPLAK